MSAYWTVSEDWVAGDEGREAFVVLDLAVTAVFFIFPDIILWLPRAAGLIP